MNDNDPREDEGRWSLTTAKQFDDSESTGAGPFSSVLARRQREREASLREAADYVAMDRRRQNAARRCPPLRDGRRDPLGSTTDRAS